MIQINYYYDNYLNYHKDYIQNYLIQNYYYHY